MLNEKEIFYMYSCIVDVDSTITFMQNVFVNGPFVDVIYLSSANFAP